MTSKDPAGLKFGRLVVLGKNGKDNSGKTLVNTKCSCGTSKTIRLSDMTSAKIVSCGCRNKDRERLVAGVGIVDVKVKDVSILKEALWYTKWVSMLKRVYKIDNPCYKGVTVCEEWLLASNFMKWHEDNFKQVREFKMVLDKDLTVLDSKTYSPTTCSYVPEILNSIYLKGKGVSFDEKRKGKQWRSRVSMRFYGTSHQKLHSTEREAVSAYEETKVAYVVSVTDHFRGLVNEDVLDNCLMLTRRGL